MWFYTLWTLVPNIYSNNRETNKQNTHAHVHTHMCTHTCAHVHIHTHTCAHVHMHTHTHTHMYTCTHTHTPTHPHTYIPPPPTHTHQLTSEIHSRKVLCSYYIIDRLYSILYKVCIIGMHFPFTLILMDAVLW